MASGSTAMLRRAARDCLCQASAEHFQQCAEFLPLRNRGLGPLAVTMLPHCACREGHRFRFSMPRKGLRPPFLRAFDIGLWFRSVNFLDSVVRTSRRARIQLDGEARDRHIWP